LWGLWGNLPIPAPNCRQTGYNYLTAFYSFWEELLVEAGIREFILGGIIITKMQFLGT
jgi:hypothetical protein